MKRNIQIFVEGDADVTFLISLFEKHFGIFFEKPSKEESKKRTNISRYFNNETINISLIPIGGYNKIRYQSEEMKKVYDYEGGVGINLVIQDADTIEKDHGSFEKRVEFIEMVKAEIIDDIKNKYNIEIDFNYYLFPYSAYDESGNLSGRDGDLETLLFSIANPYYFNKFLNCKKAYIECLKTLCDKDYWKEHELGKSIIYDYIQIYNGMSKAKEATRSYFSDFWDLDHPDLKPLISFLYFHLYGVSLN